MCWGCGNCGNCGNCCVSNCSNCKDWKSPGRDYQKHVEKVHNDIARMIAAKEKEALAIESDIIEAASSILMMFVFNLKKYSANRIIGGKKLNINFEMLEQEHEKLKGRIEGHIGKVLREKLVPTNKDLQTILWNDDDAAREKAFSSYCSSVYDEAMESLKKELTKVIEEEKEMISKELNSRIKEASDSVNKSRIEYEKIMELDSADRSAVEEKQIGYMYKYEIYEFLKDELSKEQG